MTRHGHRVIVCAEADRTWGGAAHDPQRRRQAHRGSVSRPQWQARGASGFRWVSRESAALTACPTRTGSVSRSWLPASARSPPMHPGAPRRPLAPPKTVPNPIRPRPTAASYGCVRRPVRRAPCSVSSPRAAASDTPRAPVAPEVSVNTRLATRCNRPRRPATARVVRFLPLVGSARGAPPRRQRQTRRRTPDGRGRLG